MPRRVLDGHIVPNDKVALAPIVSEHPVVGIELLE